MIDAPFLRAQEGKWFELSGAANNVDYHIRIGLQKGTAVEGAEEKRHQIQVNSFSVDFQVPTGLVRDSQLMSKNVGSLATSFNIADGETIVVGASQISQESKEPGAAMITIVTAKVP